MVYNGKSWNIIFKLAVNVWLMMVNDGEYLVNIWLMMIYGGFHKWG